MESLIAFISTLEGAIGLGFIGVIGVIGIGGLAVFLSRSSGSKGPQIYWKTYVTANDFILEVYEAEHLFGHIQIIRTKVFPISERMDEAAAEWLRAIHGKDTLHVKNWH